MSYRTLSVRGRTRQAQVAIDFRVGQYNHVRPHHALGVRATVPEALGVMELSPRIETMIPTVDYDTRFQRLCWTSSNRLATATPSAAMMPNHKMTTAGPN
jgi:hypothetical protein